MNETKINKIGKDSRNTRSLGGGNYIHPRQSVVPDFLKQNEAEIVLTLAAIFLALDLFGLVWLILQFH